MNFKKFEKSDMDYNVFDNFDDGWMLVSAGTTDNYNTMTASWGGVGFIWTKPVFFLVIRKNRYTAEFLEANETFTCAYFPNEYKDALALCGSKSGRDIDKAKETGLTVEAVPGYDAVTFKEAKQTFVCKKVLHQPLEESCFDDKELFKEFYTEEEPHILFIGTIEEYGE